MEFLKNAADKAKLRAETAMAGKKLVDEGGPTFEAYLTAKANYRSAVQADAVSLEHIQDTIAQYEAVISEIGKVLSSDISDEQKAELAVHVESTKARLQAYTRIANAIDAPPSLPAISPPEEDAIKMLYVKGKVEDAKTRSTNAANKAMEKLKEAKGGATPAPAAA